ncbi:hypothetical protein [Nocardiopsis coralliicola]
MAGTGSLLLAGAGAAAAALAPAAALLAYTAVMAGGAGVLASLAVRRSARSELSAGEEQAENSRQARALLDQEHTAGRLPESVREYFSSWDATELENGAVLRLRDSDRNASEAVEARSYRAMAGLAAAALAAMAAGIGALVGFGAAALAIGAVGAGSALLSLASGIRARRRSAQNAETWAHVGLLCSEISARTAEDARARSAAEAPAPLEYPHPGPAPSLAGRALRVGAHIAVDLLRTTPNSRYSAVRAGSRAAGTALTARRRPGAARPPRTGKGRG